jgi:hypothetical protein
MDHNSLARKLNEYNYQYWYADRNGVSSQFQTEISKFKIGWIFQVHLHANPPILRVGYGLSGIGFKFVESNLPEKYCAYQILQETMTLQNFATQAIISGLELSARI